MNDSGDKGSLAGLRVMVIDDSKTIRRTAETLLKKEGCDVQTAVDGFEALSKISDLKPQIIFVDIMMPRLDGYQTCALIKNNRQFRATPVIMLSSKDGLFDKARGRIVGAEQYLTKPFTRDELLEAIRRHAADGLIRIRRQGCIRGFHGTHTHHRRFADGCARLHHATGKGRPSGVQRKQRRGRHRHGQGQACRTW